MVHAPHFVTCVQRCKRGLARCHLSVRLSQAISISSSPVSLLSCGTIAPRLHVFPSSLFACLSSIHADVVGVISLLNTCFQRTYERSVTLHLAENLCCRANTNWVAAIAGRGIVCVLSPISSFETLADPEVPYDTGPVTPNFYQTKDLVINSCSAY
jgi:hypothetical protein